MWQNIASHIKYEIFKWKHQIAPILFPHDIFTCVYMYIQYSKLFWPSLLATSLPMSVIMPLLTVPPCSRAGPSWTRLWSGCSSTRESPASSWSTVSQREDWWGAWKLNIGTTHCDWHLTSGREKGLSRISRSWWGTINVFIWMFWVDTLVC